jgi:rhodanese-related sulfurtransferase
MTAALTGASEKTLNRWGMKYEKVYIHAENHAGYFPGAARMTIKLLFDPETGRLLGAQIVGGDGVDKRIDVLATAIRAGMTVHDLEELELAYAPQYGSARDPVNVAGFVAANALKGDVKLAQAKAALPGDGDGTVLLDVRTGKERAAGNIPGSAHIPLDELRDRLAELPGDREIRAFCEVGRRGYLACRILSQRGFTCSNLTGGYRTYRQCHPE